MGHFILQYGLCILLCSIGLFFIIVSYYAAHAGRSGVPFIGGIFIAIGFLTTPVKWLALLGLIDYGYWSLPYFLIMDRIHNKRFGVVYSKQDYAESIRDDTKLLLIRIPNRNEELLRPYITSSVYELRVPKLLFSVCSDKMGKRFLLVDKCINGNNIEILEFDKNSILLTGLKSKDIDLTVEIEIVMKKC